MCPDPITAIDLEAYMDDELDPGRKLAVEAYLAASPDAAAKLMADLRMRTALRIAQPALDDCTTLTESAQRLTAKLAEPRRPLAAFLARHRKAAVAAASATLIGTVMLLPRPELKAAPPLYVEDAVESFQTSLLRASMHSQLETPVLDSRDIQRFTRIRVPRLPEGWTITDVQLFPSDDGPALQIMVSTAHGKRVSIFAVRNAAKAPARPTVVQQRGTSVAYWRNGDIAYALTGMGAPRALDLAAQDLADNRLD